MPYCHFVNLKAATQTACLWVNRGALKRRRARTRLRSGSRWVQQHSPLLLLCANSLQLLQARQSPELLGRALQDQEDGAIYKERLSNLLSNSPGTATYGREFGGLGSHPLTADLAGLASCESSSSYAEFHCDASSLLDRQTTDGAHLHLGQLPARAVCRALQLPGEVPGHSLEEPSQQSPSWPLIEVVEIIRRASGLSFSKTPALSTSSCTVGLASQPVPVAPRVP